MSKLRMFRNRNLLILVPIISSLLLVVLACGGDDGDSASDSSAAAPAAKPAPTATTAAAKPAKAAEPKAPAAADGPSGTLTAALKTVGTPIGTPGLCVPGCANEKYFYSAFDTILQWHVDGKVVPAVAESWDLAPDLSSFTWHIRPGIPFHTGGAGGGGKDWGEVTAEDVAFSFDQVNSNTNPESVHDVAGDMSCCYGPTTVIDTYTAETEIIAYDSRAPGWLMTNLRDSFGISSKKVYDEFGSDGMREVFVGSGPYQVLEWTQGDRVVLEAVDHYRKTPDVKTVTLLEVPEEAARIAMFKAGEAHITHTSLPNVSVLEDAGGVKRLLEVSIRHMGMNPNFLEKINPKSGEPLDNPGFDPSFAWVSDPFADGCNWDILLEVVPDEADVCDEMNNPRKVRRAMSMAIDRDALVEGLLDGLGKPGCNWAISVDNAAHKDEWCMKHDPDGARALMEEAGQGPFTIGIWVGNEPQEIHQAVSSMWEQELGITTEYHTGPFSVWQPTFVDRSFQHLVFDGEQGGMPAHYAKGREAQAWFAGGIMWSGGIPFYQRIYGNMLGEADEGKRTAMAIEFGDHEAFWDWDPTLWEEPIYTVYTGSYMNWELESTSMHTQSSNFIYPLEDITLK